MLLVTGGQDGNYDYLDTTELLPLAGAASWRLVAGLLPRPMASMSLATVANTVFMIGEELHFDEWSVTSI